MLIQQKNFNGAPYTTTEKAELVVNKLMWRYNMDFLTKFIRSKTQSPSNSQKIIAKIPDKVRKNRAGNVPRNFVQDLSQDGIYFH